MSASPVTYYEILEVSSDASAEEISRAYKRKRRDVHPDRGGSGALWRLFQEAADTLTDPHRRAAYDAQLRGGAPAPSSTDSPAPKPSRSSSYDPAIHDDTWDWKMPSGPSQPSYFPPFGKPLAADDPRAQHARHSKLVTVLVWVLPVLSLARAALVAGTGYNPYPAWWIFIMNAVSYGVPACVPLIVVMLRRRGRREAAEHHNVKVAHADLALATAAGYVHPVVDQRLWGSPATRAQEIVRDGLLRMTTFVPAARIFNQVGWQDSNGIHHVVDHVVVVGARVAMISSHAWSAGQYTWTGSALMRNGELMPPLHIGTHEEAMRTLLGPVPTQVRSWAVQVNGAAHLDNQDQSTPVVHPPTLVENLTSWLVEDNPHADIVDRRLVDVLRWRAQHS